MDWEVVAWGAYRFEPGGGWPIRWEMVVRLDGALRFDDEGEGCRVCPVVGCCHLGCCILRVGCGR